MNLFRLSEPQRKARRGWCPFCNYFLRDGLPITVDGRAVPVSKTFYPTMPKSALAECPECGSSWPVFAGSLLPVVRHPGRLIAVVQTEQSLETIGEQTRELDNLGGTEEMTSTETFREQWSKSFTLGEDSSFTKGIKASIGPDVAKLEGTAEKAVKNKYELTTSTEREYVEEFTVKVPPRTLTTIHVEFKRVWQQGVVKVEGFRGMEVAIPFKVAVDLRKDVRRTDSATRD